MGIENSKLKEAYDDVLKSGMFFEYFPELTGDWEIDKITIKEWNDK